MKKVFIILLTVFVLCTSVAYAADIPVYVDGAALEFDVTPKMINDRVMVPMRKIFETLGATVAWDGETQTITAFKSSENGENVIILIQIDNKRAFVNNEVKELDSHPVLIDERTLVPVRFVSEALGCTVVWNEAEEAVYITTNSVKGEETASETAGEAEEAEAATE